jgi:rhodanese-related sulfurtransferase
MKRFMFNIPLLLATLGLVLVAACQASPDQDSEVNNTVKDMVEKAAGQAGLISIKDLAGMIEGGRAVNIIDIRTEAEFKAGHIRGARWIPRGKIEFTSAEEGMPPKDGLMVVYCKKQGRASLCAVRLGELGFTQVKYLEGGFKAWCQAGHSIYNLHGELVVKEFEKKEE